MKNRMKILLGLGMVMLSIIVIGPMAGSAMSTGNSTQTMEDTKQTVAMIGTLEEEVAQEEAAVPEEEVLQEEAAVPEEEVLQEEAAVPEEEASRKEATIQEEALQGKTSASEEAQGQETVVVPEGNSQEAKELEAKFDKLEKLRNRLEELENKEELTPEEEDECFDLPARIQGIELELGVYDYKGGIEISLNTLEVSIQDMKRDLAYVELTEEIVADLNNRITHLTPVYEKYRAIMDSQEENKDADYKAIGEQFYQEMEQVWAIIN